MAEQGEMSKETFLQVAESSGLDVTDTVHMDELYAVVKGVLPNVKHLREMDLSDIEPATTYAPPTEEVPFLRDEGEAKSLPPGKRERIEPLTLGAAWIRSE